MSLKRHFMLLSGVLGLCSQVYGGSHNHQSLEESTKEAALIFEGEVVKVEYKNSAPNQQHPKGLPHTFVTYRVQSVLRGKAEGQFTLRFFGGLHPDGTAMEVSHFPTFDVGERDLLFVKGNTLKGCPLVQCDHGRFRIEQNKVYDSEGRAVLLGKEDKLTLGKPQMLASVQNHTYVHPTNGKSVTVQTKGAVVEAFPVEAGHLTLEQFKRHLLASVKGVPVSGQEKSALVGQAVPAISLMPSSPISMPPATVVPPQNQEEIQELQKLKESNGNPVISQ